MYISELELHGFKSFAYKTKLSFDSGITAIVGPNGCGKSNVVDAMRWVLGEQRPTLLRSSTMTNVIFNGTSQKSALGMAEVSMTFVNNKGLLPTEYSEVTIARRLYRSGESEYLINGTKCRLKDIMELFMDTGMGSDAYSVIELNMVEEILNDKNNDRRHLFEEAAGVTRYKEKRKKTFRKLDETRSDLQRVEDILGEVRKQARSLERQAERAQKAKTYRKELEHLDKALNKHEFEKIQEELEPLQERIDNAEKEKKEILQKAEELEQQEEAARAKLNEKERRQSEAQRKVNQLQNKISETETTLRITREKIRNEESVIDQYTRDINQSEEDLEELRELFEATAAKLDTFEEKLEKAEENLRESKEQFSNVQQQFSKERSDLNELENRHRQAVDERNEIQAKRIRLESRIENSSEDLERIQREKEEIEREIELLKQKRSDLEDELEAARSEKRTQEEKLDEARAKRDELTEQREQLKDQIREQTSKLEAVQSEIKLLREIAGSNEAFPSSVRYLLDHHNGDFSLLTVLSDIFSTDREHAVALESVLGDALNYVVVERIDDARKAADILKNEDKGRATFIPLDRLSDSYPVQPGSLFHQVDSDERFVPLKQLLLGNVLLFDSVDEAYSGIENAQTVGVTPAGEVVTSARFLKSGSKSKHAGIRVGLQDKITALENRAGGIGSTIHKLEKQLQDLSRERDQVDIEQHEHDLRSKEEDLRTIEQDLHDCTSKIQIYEKNLGELDQRKERLLESETSSRGELENLDPRREELDAAIRELEEKQNEKREILEKLEEERSIAQGRYNDAQLNHQDLKNKVETHEREIRRAENGIQNLKERLELRSERKEKARERIKQYKTEIEELEQTLTETREQKKAADERLEEAEEACARQRGNINETEKELKEVRRRKEVNMELLHHLTMAKEKFELKAENLSDHIWETYDILMEQIEEVLPEDKEPEEAKERITWLRQKLNRIGEVNPLAIEEYEEEKERLDFYEEQISDLQKAEEELMETIEEINKTALERFNETFESIRTNFRDVFHTLFNEDDYCDLVIEEDAEDPLEAKIEIKANPRGKRPSTINQLSGGEKTLTAIALLFAIYLVKPSPFCVLDEVDAPLDDANIERFAGMIKKFSEDTQFIIITHNKKTMSKAEMMYGITMPETGISRLVGVKLDEIAEV